MRISPNTTLVLGIFYSLFFLNVNIFAAELSIQYSESETVVEKSDDAYTHPALVIDNHAYLREQEERRRSGYTTQQRVPVIIINNNVSSKDYRYGQHGYMKDDSWGVGYSSGGTSFYYVNGLRPNCCGPYTIIGRPVRPVPYDKRKRTRD